MELTKESLEKFYKNHSTKDTYLHFNVSKEQLINCLLKYNIEIHSKKENISLTLLNKSEEQKALIELKRRQTNQLKYGCDNVAQVKEISNKISNTVRNFTKEQKQHRLEAFHNTINSKSDEEKELIKQHRSEATKRYFENMSEEDRRKFSKTMSEVYSNFSDEVKKERSEKIRRSYAKSCLNKYGVKNCLQVPEIQEKIKQTNIEKYGVPYFCMNEKCRSALGGNSSQSKPNLNFKELLELNNIKYKVEYPLGNYSYDFKINDILIEINPYSTHNSTYSPFNSPKDKKYHYNKSLLARESGFRCIHIWDWDDLDKILFLLKEQEVVYARKCEVKEVDKNVSKEFLNTYHLQGNVKDDIRIGLYFNDELISLMTFGKPRYNYKYEVELLRYVSIKKVIGGAEKLFKKYIQKYNPSSIISYCDLSKFTGNVYKKLGFNYVDYSIGKHWYNPKTREHYTDNLLRQRGVDQLLGTYYGKGTNNEELMRLHNFVEVYDAGQAKYVW